MRVFLSHSGRDKALVREIKDHFPPWLKAWIDEERLLFGTDLAPSLREAIDTDVDYVVLLFGRDAADSPWVKQEIAWALEREEQLGRTFLLPVLLEDVRDRLEEFGLAGRLTLEMSDFSSASTRGIAERLVNHLGGWMSEQLALAPRARRGRGASDSLRLLIESAVGIIDEIPRGWRTAVELDLVRPFIKDLAETRSGAIPLTDAGYYTRILREMSHAGATTNVIAVSTLSSQLWRHDADQTRYATRNLEAVARGASIQRLFILPALGAISYADEIRRQADAGIDVKVATTSILAHVSEIEDFVLFDTPNGTRAYVAKPSIDGSQRIRCGVLHLSDHAIASMGDAFDDAWDLADSRSAFFGARAGKAPRNGSRAAPGTGFQVYELPSAVVGCEEAAAARNIPLGQELKTLLLQTDNGVVAAHLPGDGVLDLRKVKRRLDTREAYLADPEQLLGLGLSPGTVSAVLDPVWSMPHLISRRVLNMSTVMTNNGTLHGYFEFSPSVLTDAATVLVDDFEK